MRRNNIQGVAIVLVILGVIIVALLVVVGGILLGSRQDSEKGQPSLSFPSLFQRPSPSPTPSPEELVAEPVSDSDDLVTIESELETTLVGSPDEDFDQMMQEASSL